MNKTKIYAPQQQVSLFVSCEDEAPRREDLLLLVALLCLSLVLGSEKCPAIMWSEDFKLSLLLLLLNYTGNMYCVL